LEIVYKKKKFRNEKCSNLSGSFSARMSNSEEEGTAVFAQEFCTHNLLSRAQKQVGEN
jgi:hypothetical protein